MAKHDRLEILTEQFFRWLRPVLAAATVMAVGPSFTSGQEPSAGLQAVQALEEVLVDSIARTEKSVVAIGRVLKDKHADPSGFNPGGAADGLGGESSGDPTSPGFLPHEFGSGIVVDSAGLILTNYHVLGDIGTSDYWVWAAGKPYLASVKAADPWLDLAVLQIAAEGLTPLPLGDADGLKKGQIVVALGNPYAIARDGTPSAAWGIVSNLSRRPASPQVNVAGAEGKETLHDYGTLIQTDVRLEQGGSGGALVNLKGELVGVTTAMAAISNGERPGGFAIPVDDDFRRALDTLKSGRAPEYGFLGVAPTHLSAEQRRAGQFGARILDVVPATPAARAGLQVGDVITYVGETPIADELQLVRRLSGLAADAQVQLTVLRGNAGARSGKKLEVDVTLSKKRVTGHRQPFSEVSDPAWRGMRVDYATASAQFREQSRDLDPDGSVAVLAVDPNSAAWQAGLRPGDFVSFVGKAHVATPQQFRDAVAELKGPVTVRLTAVAEENALRTVPGEAAAP